MTGLERMAQVGRVAVQRVEIQSSEQAGDALATRTIDRMKTWLGVAPTKLQTRCVVHLDLGLNDAEAADVARALTDPISETSAVGVLPDDAPVALTIGFLRGVTDSVGTSVRRAAEDRLGRPLHGAAFTSTVYLLWGVDAADAERAARSLFFNPLIEWLRVESAPRVASLDVPAAGTEVDVGSTEVPLRGLADEELARISADGMLALSLAEMKAIAAHFDGRDREPTVAELECLAQTWSEHCKHKTFAGPICYTGSNGVSEHIEEGLFARYIKGATKAVAEDRVARGLDPEDAAFLVSVFHDNAGVVRFTDDDHLVYKVETHNSPSALDPYGGAMTGIVGVNRDSFGTGRGADLLTNVWGYCFADPAFEGRVPTGLMHPRRLRDGVHHGVIDGGNQSGVPYSRGFELFDDRYLGKPLVYCGTVAVMPVMVGDSPTHEKPVAVGDFIVMVGGRIGKDGIHGATFSSAQLDENSPVHAVQIGDPITQKMMFDMLAEARSRGLYSGMTDNGAGGLSSSVGEMAELTGGACIDLRTAPLKYPGLAPWEILISEAQERMTIAVPADSLEAFMRLALAREVEATALGQFTATGSFEVTYGETEVVSLPLDFLHDGWPRATLRAQIDRDLVTAPNVDQVAARLADCDLKEAWLDLLASPNIASGEARARSYDHEVKGLSVVKPFVGTERNIPATATVMLARHGGQEGVVLGEGIHPFYSDFSAEQMALACVDEAVRRVLCGGARLDRLAGLDNFCWPDPIESATTPDGRHKLALLVDCCRGLRAACEAYGLPLISGKDSMKNDALIDGVKISIPPTLLVSVMGQLEDVSRALTLQPRREGEQVWLVGNTADELGGSELLRRLGVSGGVVPRTDLELTAADYAAFVATRDAGLVRAAHVCGRGGLAVAASHMAMACNFGLTLEIGDELGAAQALFSESTGRIVFTAAPDDEAVIAKRFASARVRILGTVEAADEDATLVIRRRGRNTVSLRRSAMLARFGRGLTGQ